MFHDETTVIWKR